MNNKIKYFAILPLIITLLFSCVIFADDTVYIEGSLRYIINDNGEVTITSYKGKDEEVKVPMNMGRYIVTSIAPGAFKGTNVKKIELPDTITSLDADSFDDVRNLNIEYYDKDDIIVELDIPINNLKEEIAEENNESINEIINEEERNETVIIDDTQIEINEGFDNIDIEDSDELFNDEQSDNIDGNNDLNEKDEIIDETNNQSASSNSNISLNEHKYLLLVIFAIGVVSFIIIRRKK